MKLDNCIICGKNNLKTIYKDKDRNVVECLNDGLVFVNPIPQKEQLAKYYSKEYFKTNFPDEEKQGSGFVNYALEEKFIRSGFKDKLSKLEKFIKPQGRLLDVGCALGFGVSEAEKKGWNAVGIDISKYAVKYCKKNSLKVRQGELEKIKFRYKFSVIFTSHILEHVHDPLVFLRKAGEMLKSGGVLYLAMPNQKSFIARIMGSKWFDYRREQHLWFYNPSTIRKLLTISGFEILEYGIEYNKILPKHIAIRLRSYYKNPLITKLAILLEFIFKIFGSESATLPLGNMYFFARK